MYAHAHVRSTCLADMCVSKRLTPLYRRDTGAAQAYLSKNVPVTRLPNKTSKHLKCVLIVLLKRVSRPGQCLNKAIDVRPETFISIGKPTAE